MMQIREAIANMRQLGLLRQSVGYLALFMLLLCIFAYWRFPATTLKVFIQKVIADSSINAKITLGETSLTLLPGVTIKKIMLFESYENAPVGLIIDQLTVRPAWISSITGSPGINIRADVMGGEVWAVLSTNGLPGEEVTGDIWFEHLNPGAVPLLNKNRGVTLSILLSGNGSFNTSIDNPIDGTGQIEASFTDGLITLPPHLLKDAPPINIDEGELTLSLNKGVVKVDSFTFAGEQIEGEVSGEIILGQRAKFSRLNLTVKLLPKGKLKERIKPFLLFFKPGPNGELTFKIGGTVAAPKLG